MKRVFAFAVGLLLLGSEFSQAGETVVSDGAFADGKWRTEVIPRGPDGTHDGSATQKLSGGNPGKYREVFAARDPDTSGPDNSTGVWSFKKNAPYDPSVSGEIVELDVAIDAIQLIGGPSGGGLTPALRQDGTVYSARFVGVSIPETTWTHHEFPGLTESDFRDPDNITETPDFSATGGPIEFGWVYVVSSGSGDPVSRTVGFDNWKLVINPAPGLGATRDSFVNRAQQHDNEGANPRLIIGKKDDRRRRVVLAFKAADIDDFILAHGLTSATLVLTIAENDGGWGSSGRAVDARPLLRRFKEGNGKIVGVPSAKRKRGSGEGVTWKCATDKEIANNRRNCANPWNGGKFGEALAPKVIHTDGLTGEVTWDVTDDVLAGASGWVVKKRNEHRGGQVRYYSKEGAAVEGDGALRPRLILE